jgi:Flp pilus assembly pilin Flp
MRKFWKLLREEKAATAVEYAMIVAMIAIVATAAIISVANATGSKWNVISTNVTSNM